MTTIVTKTVKPSGGDYSLLSTALAAIPLDLVAADERWDIVVYEKVDGYSEALSIPSINSSSTCYVNIYSAEGETYNPVDGSGAYITTFANYSSVISNNNCDYLSIVGLGVINTGTASSTCIANLSANVKISGVYAELTRSDSIVISLNNSLSARLENSVMVGGSVGVNTGNWSNGEIINNLAINNRIQGFQKGNSGSDWLLKNNLYLGDGAFTLVSDWLVGSGYNASSDNTAVGSNSLQNRTTADVVNYDNDDFRTSASSALANAGDGVNADYIGFELESSSGVNVSVTEVLKSFTEASAVNISYNVELTVNETLGAFTESSIVNIENVPTTIVVNESLSPLIEASTINVDLSVSAIVTETLNSFLEGSNVTIAKDIDAVVTENLNGFQESSSIQFPITITFNPKNTVRVKRQSNTVRVKRNSNIVRVK